MPVAQKEPAGHAIKHDALANPVVFPRRPPGHAVQANAPTVLPYLPAAQTVHGVFSPGPTPDLPTAQSVHAVEPTTFEYCPDGQGPVQLLEFRPSLAPYVPVGQFTHAVEDAELLY